MGKAKISINEKLNTIHQILSGKESVSQAAMRLSLDASSVNEWMISYKSCGEDIFIQKGNNHYSNELKEQAVMAYLNGEGSLRDICEKYGIRRKTQLRQWIKKYNGHEELKASGTGGAIIMTKGRKTSFEERVEIVQYCISHDRNYAETARKYNVSYQQARNYTVKYEAGGVEALRDGRGRTKPKEEMSELERLRAENKILQAEKERAEMEISFLKKINEVERRRG